MTNKDFAEIIFEDIKEYAKRYDVTSEAVDMIIGRECVGEMYCQIISDIDREAITKTAYDISSSYYPMAASCDDGQTVTVSIFDRQGPTLSGDRSMHIPVMGESYGIFIPGLINYMAENKIPGVISLRSYYNKYIRVNVSKEYCDTISSFCEANGDLLGYNNPFAAHNKICLPVKYADGNDTEYNRYSTFCDDVSTMLAVGVEKMKEEKSIRKVLLDEVISKGLANGNFKGANFNARITARLEIMDKDSTDITTYPSGQTGYGSGNRTGR